MSQPGTPDREAEVMVIGGGVLGVAVAYWLVTQYDASIDIVDTGASPALHTSSRNTGIIHRPFYLDPEKKRTWALASLVSHPMWHDFASRWGLPWRPMGTMNVALTDTEEATIQTYGEWGVRNGMDENELEVVDGTKVSSFEPEVRCRSALVSKTDVSVDFGAFTRKLLEIVVSYGATFRGGSKVVGTGHDGGSTWVRVRSGGRDSWTKCKAVFNAAGGGALELAHDFGLAKRYAALNFRGEYWVVDEPFASKVKSNVYRPPRHPEFPFLDPHFVVRADGTREIGPNAVLVTGPYVYSGVGARDVGSIFSKPLGPKLGLARNPEFLSLVAEEWRSSLSKSAMVARVKKFIPGLSADMMHSRAVFGVRSSLVDADGFVPEAVLVHDQGSVHILNFNSPGATGAPFYSAMVVKRAKELGLLDGLRKRPTPVQSQAWSTPTALAGL